jgi:hypothetical protein
MTRRIYLLTFAALVVGCRNESATTDSVDTSTTAPPVSPEFATVADSEWVDVKGPTLIGFYPIRTNEQLEKDEGLATALDDFAYHIGTAMDSLYAQGFTVHYRGGDTVWLRMPLQRWRFVRDADSADVGYVMTDTTRNMATMYGVRGYVDLIEYAREFRTTGKLRPR